LMGEFEARHFRPIVDGVGLDEPYQHYQFAGRADFVAWRLSRHRRCCTSRTAPASPTFNIWPGRSTRSGRTWEPRWRCGSA
jgi:hypothetical protein